MFAARQEQFMKAMGGGVAIIRTNPVVLRNNDTDFPHRPDSSFWYLTGFREPDAVAVFAPDHPEHKFILFVNPRDPAKEVWNGRRAGVEGAVAEYGADVAYSLEEMDEKLPQYIENVETLHYGLGQDADFDALVLKWLAKARRKVRTGISAPEILVDPARILHEMRLFKGPEEIERMRRSASIAAEAHREAMALCRPGINECELHAVIEYTFRKRGANAPSYNPICGSGPNSCILHYNDNNRVIGDKELVLVDAGCEVDGYASDITRTFPSNGVFSAEQRALYEVVLEAQEACIEMVRPGTVWQDIHDEAVRVLTIGLVKLGILEGPVEKAIETSAYKKFYMHKTGHWLGLDVHDVGKYRVQGEWRKLEPGMVMTVEPGLYVAANTEGVDPKWWDLGIRIEDDVLVTETGHEVLTFEVPKSVVEIQALMQPGTLVGRP